jgi:hypothetical protein
VTAHERPADKAGPLADPDRADEAASYADDRPAPHRDFDPSALIGPLNQRRRRVAVPECMAKHSHSGSPGPRAAINEHGQIVGTSGDAPVLWQNGKLTRLPELPGHLGGAAVAINEQNQIVGWCTTQDLQEARGHLDTAALILGLHTDRRGRVRPHGLPARQRVVA